MNSEASPAPPHTPTRNGSEPPQPEPNSSRVTINLRTTRPLEPIPSTPQSPTTPSKMINGGEDASTRVSIESESDALSTIPAIETPTSSSSALGSPEIEVLTVHDDDDFVTQSPQVAIINDDEDLIEEAVHSFPYRDEGESPLSAVKKVAQFIQWREIDNDDCFCKLRDWIQEHLISTEDCADSWYESYAKHRDFWKGIPEVVFAFSWRSRFFGSFLKSNRSGYRTLAEFFFQFARLTARFVMTDMRALARHTQSKEIDEEIEVFSALYLNAYSYLLRKEEQSHIGRNLETHYDWNWEEEVPLLSSNFLDQGGTLQALTKLNEGQLRLASRNSKLIDNLSEPCRLAYFGLVQACKVLDDVDRNEKQVVDTARQQIGQAYEFFTIMSSGLCSIIEKQVTSLTPDTTMSILNSLAFIFQEIAGNENSEARSHADTLHREHPDLPLRMLPMVVSLEWKFSILKKLIMSTQMQLRVIGVTTMCTDLLRIYNEQKGLDAARSPILLYFADFVIQNKIIEYLVGVGSHPEIINEGYNVLGFLVVTKTYKDSQASTTWQTVTNSQDPRVVEAILRMLKRCFELQDYASLLFLCGKVNTLRIEAFNVVMREFCDTLIRGLITKASSDGIRYIDAPPYELCVRLIRESSKITPDCPVGYPDVQNFAAGRFRDLLTHGPPPETRNEIYLDCIADITARTITAPGSICVINALLRQNITTDLRILTTEHGLTKLVIKELESAIAEDHQALNPLIRDSPASLARRELLRNIIIFEPGTISAELGADLWNLLVGPGSKNIADRDISWQILNVAMKRSSFSNVFLDTCFKSHLPTLPPSCFTVGTLDFVREAIFAWLELVRHKFVEEDRTFESLALDQLWRMILNAPPNTIDAHAINLLVEVYVDSPLILSLPRAKARSIHLALVDRCLKQLALAATKLRSFDQDGRPNENDDGMLDESGAEFQTQEMIFARSLAVLREFLAAYQSKPQFATPKFRPAAPIASSSLEGEPLTVKYQSFDGDTHTEVRSLTLGKLNTAASLFASLEKATGFKSYKVYCGGKVFDPDEIEVCRSLEDLNLNGLVLVQKREEADGSTSLVSSGKTNLEFEIIKHLDELWGYLGMHEKVAREIYMFLVKFPPYEHLQQKFDSDDVSYIEIFPQGQPFKSLYAIHALREYIVTQSQKGNVNGAALTRAISLIVSAISDQAVVDSCKNEEMCESLALHLVDCFIQFLREPVLPDSVSPHLTDTLLSRLMSMLYDAKTALNSPHSHNLTWRCFEAVLEACLHNSDLWALFKTHINQQPLLRDLLLEEPRSSIRKSVAKQIITKCTFSQSRSPVSTVDFTLAFWPLIRGLVPEACKKPQQCDELLSLCLALFKVGEKSLDSATLENIYTEWATLLLSHTSIERVDHLEGTDLVAHGLANLCHCAIMFAKKRSDKSLPHSNIGADLFRRHLFPDLSQDVSDSDPRLIVPRTPLLNSSTRHTIAETIFLLVKDDETQYRKILDLLHELVPYIREPEGSYIYDLPFLFERSRSIRSQTGYVGLKNLSNTCYLNSLFTQLFMNIPFREFMINALLVDGGSSQKLLHETQILFSYMQNTVKRFIDPANLAMSIRTYEDTTIDVNVQMDVDEFYNLLFDRWESQMLAEEDKTRFRSFYGGKLVQQIKSKECSHISEVQEPFSAIQCDIKGKSCLEESLQAYVDGEIMEADNKYKCTPCDRHVDAVKRACLKDLPDSLIFHLKRFDFNVRSMQRSKINDYFSFPQKIDMRPYKVEHLMGPLEKLPEDIFELVGILVHSGTAESGHYFSYIRERPSSSDKAHWVEFNDDLVTPWDLNSMESKCFGGFDLTSANFQIEKQYSAYMLFYQRSSALAIQTLQLNLSGIPSPVRLPIAPRLSNHIEMENELSMRKYCLYDPAHTNFVTKMLSNIKHINNGRCSGDHDLEKHAIIVALNHLDQVISRAKDTPDFVTTMLPMRQICHSCAECSRDFLEWFCDRPDALRNLLLRNPEPLVRTEMASSILSALVNVKSEIPYAYWSPEDDSSGEENPQLVQRVVETVSRLWDQFHTNTRAWPEYFGLLGSIAKLGDFEAAILLDFGFLRKAVEVVSADANLPLSAQLTRMLNIISKRMNTRPVSYDAVINLLYRLLQVCDWKALPLRSNERRLDYAESEKDKQPFPLTDVETKHLVQHWVRGHAHILTEKLLQINQNQYATDNILIILLKCEAGLDNNIFQAIAQGIRKTTPPLPCGPFLRAAVLYCHHSEMPDAVLRMVTYVSKVTHSLENTDGREFLQFFKDVLNLSPHRQNDPSILRICLDLVPKWAPALLNYWESSVRDHTEKLVVDLLLNQDPEADLEEDEASVDRIVVQHLGFACLTHLDEVYVNPRQQAVRAALENISRVIEECERYFDEDNKDEFLIRKQTILLALKKLTVEEAEEEVSDWDGSEGEYGSSEPMDSITELGGAVNEDLEMDIQL